MPRGWPILAMKLLELGMKPFLRFSRKALVVKRPS